jgi:hypothetical protein
LNQTGEVIEGAIIGRLSFIVEAASWKLSHLKVIADAFAADSFS